MKFIVYQRTACTSVSEHGGPPLCEPNEVSGTVVSVFPVAQCEGMFLRDARPLIAEIVHGRLYAVARLRVTPRVLPYWPIGQYLVVVDESADRSWGRGLVIEDGMIVAGRSACMNLDTLLEDPSGAQLPLLVPPS